MRLNTLLALLTVGAGYTVLTACDGEEKPATESDTDTDADADADTDSDTDTDVTGGTGFVFAFNIAGVATWDGTTYSGTESFEINQFLDATAPQIGAWDTLCGVSFTAAGTGPATNACVECEWDANVTFTNGVEDPPYGVGSCEGWFDLSAGPLDGGAYSYGYNPTYNYGGTDYQVLMFDNAGTWGVATAATYDAGTGAFSYDWYQYAFQL